MKNRYRAIALTYVCAMLPMALAQVTVSGVVIDSSGLAAPNASIQAMPRNEGNSGTIGSLGKWVAADAGGRFSLTLPPGRYKIAAKDEADGYPDPVFALCADPGAGFPTIMAGQTDLPDVKVVLGAQGGILEGQVIDRGARSPVVNAKITISDAHNPLAYVEVFTDRKGRFHFTVPSKPVTVSVAAAGYGAAQVFGGAQLTLAGGEHRNVVAEIDRRTGSP
jgi:hypothetical protein